MNVKNRQRRKKLKDKVYVKTFFNLNGVQLTVDITRCGMTFQ